MTEINLTAPEQYNITQEVEKFAHLDTRDAIRWLNDTGERQNISYKQLVEKMNQYANALTQAGLKAGDRMLVIIPRLPEAYYIFLGALKAGIVPISCSEMLRAKDLQYRMEHASASGIVSYHLFTDEVDKIDSSIDAMNIKLVIGT